MASSRRGQPSLSVRLPSDGGPLLDLPPVSAVFLIDFDVKDGYTISWQQAAPGIELEGLVEYKSLPSGLHTVSEDLIYFVHEGGHAGLSAFVNLPCEEEESRNARMIAVGILVPLSYGRLGRAWRHADRLKEMALSVAEDRKRTDLLEAYWVSNKAVDDAKGASQSQVSLESPLLETSSAPRQKGHSRNRSASDGAALLPPGHRLSPYHPAWSLTSLLDTFGPLIFPIQRAALLRKRILISCHAPVHETCNFVYDISVLSNIPLSVSDLLDPSSPSHRLRPLFCIGVHDISFLIDDFEASKRQNTSTEDAIADDAGTGWVACTTDSILAMKDTLWDMLITMPPPFASNAKERPWPTVECPQGVPVKATQRDLRRFRALKAGLAHLNKSTPRPLTAESPRSETSSSIRLLTGAFPKGGLDTDEALDQVVEPVTWTALAYNGFLWWASAGEQGRSEEQEEASLDASLLADLVPSTPSMSAPSPGHRASLATGMSDSVNSLTARRPKSSSETDTDEDETRTELAIIAYFHRLTTQMLTVMSDLVEAADSDPYTDEDDGDDDYANPIGREAERGTEEEEATPLRPAQSADSTSTLPMVQISSHAVESMGLDIWNAHDTEFLQEMMRRYFGHEARVEGKGFEVCGLRVC